MKAFSACSCFSLFGMMLSRNLQPQSASGLSWTGVQVGAAPLALEAFLRADQGSPHMDGQCPLCAQVCVTPASLLSVNLHDASPVRLFGTGTGSWTGWMELCWFGRWKEDGGRWSVRVSRPGRCARGCWDKSALFAYGVVFRAACICTSRGGSSLSSVFNRSRIHVFPLVPSLPFDKHELMPEARR